jgi:hypothetical protein
MFISLNWFDCMLLYRNLEALLEFSMTSLNSKDSLSMVLKVTLVFMRPGNRVADEVIMNLIQRKRVHELGKQNLSNL